MSKKIEQTPEPAVSQPVIPLNFSTYSDWAFKPILNQHLNRLRARLLNLAETSTRDRQQSDAMKGLIKDFVNEAYFPACRDIEHYMRAKGVIPDGVEQSECGRPDDRLTAHSLSDILYEPELQK